MAAVKIEYSHGELLSRQIILSTVTLVGIALLLIGLLILSTKSWVGIGMVALSPLSLWYWHKRNFLLMEITEDFIAYKYLFWEKNLPLRKIIKVDIMTFDQPAPWFKGSEELENIKVKTGPGWLDRLYFLGVPSREGAGEFLQRRLMTLNPEPSD